MMNSLEVIFLTFHETITNNYYENILSARKSNLKHHQPV